jgi:tetratricopeptide (TPR) repeat protein
MLALLLLAASSTPADVAFRHLYNADFAGAQKVIDEAIRQEPENALYYAVRAATHHFSEMDRLRILETDFFLDDEKIASKVKLKPDPAVRNAIYQSLDQARNLARARLNADPNDRDALFTMCMASSVITDYTALIERRQWRSVGLASDVNTYAQKLLALKPPVVDAYLNVGAVEYIVGSLPFFVKWFVHYDQIQGSKEKGLEQLRMVAVNGRYYAAYAKILLAVAFLREKKLPEARNWLAEFARDYPDNQIVRREIESIDRRIAQGKRK